LPLPAETFDPARARACAAARRAGVSLTRLASSWAAFTVHAALFVKLGGRLGLVLPAELLSVNYAADVRRFLIERFACVQLVLFTERVFPGVQEEVVLLFADGYGAGPAAECELRQVRTAADLVELPETVWGWAPTTLHGKWTPSLLSMPALSAYTTLEQGGAFATLSTVSSLPGFNEQPYWLQSGAKPCLLCTNMQTAANWIYLACLTPRPSWAQVAQGEYPEWLAP
jgi:hypothetical protein